MKLVLGKLIVLLVLVIAVLQIIHMTLLSRLDAKTIQQRQRKEQMNVNVVHDTVSDTEGKAKENIARMHLAISQSSVLDSSGEYQIVNNLIRADRVSDTWPNHDEITLVTHSSVHNLHHLIQLSKRWPGPLSVAIFSVAKDIDNLMEVISTLRRCYIPIRHNMSFHLVYPIHTPSDTNVKKIVDTNNQCEMFLQNIKLMKEINYAHRETPYPSNLLRNVARRNVRTEFIFIVDVDMVPNSNLHAEFFSFAQKNRLFLHTKLDDKTVYVVPAFEVLEGLDPPENKQSLLHLMDQMKVRPFYFELCWKCQKHTDYDAWQQETNPHELRVLFEVLWKDPWEPFYLSRNSVPFYDERFKQYGFNRISQVCELHVAGYKFSVLNNAFLIHQGFKTTTSFHEDKDQDQEHNRLLFRQFKNELKDKYPDSSRRCY